MREQNQAERKTRDAAYTISRWTPIVKDLMEDGIADTLDERKFPFLTNSPVKPTYNVPTSARYGRWRRDRNQPIIRNVPRLIVFIVGGATYSEMRCAYEVTNECKDWEVIIGASHILTPENFLKSLGEISK